MNILNLVTSVRVPPIFACLWLTLLFSGPACSIAHARDLELIDTFWTTANATATPGTPLPRVECDRADKHGTWALTLINRSRQDITSVRATISLPTGVKHKAANTTSPAAYFPGTVRSGDTFTLLFSLDFAAEFDNKSYRCPVTIEYFSPTKNQSYTEGVEPTLRLTGRTKIELSAGGTLEPGLGRSIPIKVSNRGTARAEELTLAFPVQPEVTNAQGRLITVSPTGSGQLTIAELLPGQTVDLNVSMYANPAAAGSAHSVITSLQYFDACRNGVKQSVPLSIGVFARLQNPLVELRSSGKFLTAQPGTVSELEIEVLNPSDEPLTKVSINASAPLESLRMLGQSRWLLDLPAGGSQKISPSVFVSNDLKERATSLQFSVQMDKDGLPYSQTFDLGLYVGGTPKLDVQDVAIVSVGGTPNLTGTLLNHGVGTARYASLNILANGQWKEPLPEPIYLGDIVENSPQPFSVTLDPSALPVDSTTEVNFEIKFVDALRESHSLNLTTTVKRPRESPTPEKQVEASSTLLTRESMGWALGGMVVGLCLAMLWRLRRTSQLTKLLHQQKLQGRKSLDEALDASQSSRSR